MKNIVALFISIAFLSGCSSLQTVSLTEIPKDRSQPVTAEVSKWMILDTNFNNDFLNEITNKLKGQCPNGKIQGILTKDEYVNYYILFYKRKITATGYCVS